MIHVVANGIVMPYLLDRNLETHLPVIPPEVEEVRFRWRAGKRKYKYNFYRLESHDQHLLLNPTIDIANRGKIPKKPGGSIVFILTCSVFNFGTIFSFLCTITLYWKLDWHCII